MRARSQARNVRQRWAPQTRARRTKRDGLRVIVVMRKVASLHPRVEDAESELQGPVWSRFQSGRDAALDRLRDWARQLLDRTQAIRERLQAPAAEDTRHDHLDQPWTALGDPALERREELLGRVHALRRHAKSGRKLNEVQVRARQVEL